MINIYFKIMLANLFNKIFTNIKLKNIRTRKKYVK